ncbi:MAG: acyl--CoA ligase, partial [Actinobacteria bacterium]|nr:acyl--CoA ligase [Actinomycetota bacterium]
MAAGQLTVGRWVRDRGSVTPDRVAIDFLDEPTTYAELDDRSERLAAALLAAGLVRGDRVASLTGNRPEHVELLFACAKAGVMLVPLNHRLAPAELAYQLDDAEPAVLFTSAEHDGLAGESLAACSTSTPRRLVLERASLDELTADAGDARDAEVGDDDPLLLVYTSGTTGNPKGALLTHANCFWTNLSFDRTSDV